MGKITIAVDYERLESISDSLQGRIDRAAEKQAKETYAAMVADYFAYLRALGYSPTPDAEG